MNVFYTLLSQIQGSQRYSAHHKVNWKIYLWSQVNILSGSQNIWLPPKILSRANTIKRSRTKYWVGARTSGSHQSFWEGLTKYTLRRANSIHGSRPNLSYMREKYLQFWRCLKNRVCTEKTSWSWAGAQSRLRQLDCKFKFSQMGISLKRMSGCKKSCVHLCIKKICQKNVSSKKILVQKDLE